tara:strand:+ start:25 stop:174 length:150 start_codon:yes stop_codon:yes gene_type:complete
VIGRPPAALHSSLSRRRKLALSAHVASQEVRAALSRHQPTRGVLPRIGG